MATLHEKVGEIQNPNEQICFEWSIAKYFSAITQKAGTIVTSPDFHFANTSWYLELYPNGARIDNTVGWISIYLKAINPRIEDKKIIFTVAIKRSDGSINEDHVSALASVFSDTNDRWGFHAFIERNKLFRDKYSLVPGGTLTVICIAECESSVKEVASQTKNSDGITTLSEDLRNLLIEEKNSDVTIKVQGRIFKVHKLILESRSSVLSAMFKHNMKENTTGTIDIDDCEPEIFHDFLLYLYSGKIEELSSGNVVGLYFLGDKYDLEDLRCICLNFMKENLDLSNICGVIVIADRLNDEELKKSTSEMIKSNLKTLIPSSQWIRFMGENPALAAELLMEVLPDSKS